MNMILNAGSQVAANEFSHVIKLTALVVSKLQAFYCKIYLRASGLEKVWEPSSQKVSKVTGINEIEVDFKNLCDSKKKFDFPEGNFCQFLNNLFQPCLDTWSKQN